MSGPAESIWAALPLGRGVTVLAHDKNGLAALSKPAGILSHPNDAGEEPRSLLTVPYLAEKECYEWNAGRLWLLNRLDSATSGVILVAADGDLAAAIRERFKRKLIRKIYHALVFGKPRQPAEIWKDRLAVKKSGGRIRTEPGHIPSESRVRLLRSDGNSPPVSLLQLEPVTGRSHQLRVQCAKRGLPIVGDQTYGDFRRNREFARASGSKRLFLHASEIGFSYEFKGREFAFAARAALPAEFGASEQV